MTMGRLAEMFRQCWCGVAYQQVGDSVNYAFEEDKGSLTIFFEGSNSLSDWVRNFLFGKRPYKDMGVPYRVHRGFLAAWKEVEDIVIDKITERKGKGYRWKHITVVGYSHGGALTFFATEAIWFHRPDLRDGGFESYAFEAPRVFCGLWVPKVLKERWANMTVVRDGCDIVTHLPPVLFGYHHVGSMLKVKGDHRLAKCHAPRCVKYHYPEVVYDALVKHESKEADE